MSIGVYGWGPTMVAGSVFSRYPGVLGDGQVFGPAAVVSLRRLT